MDMAREAGIRDCTCSGEFGCLEAFAKLVAQHEREACADIADNHIDGTPDWNSAANNIAQAIRARGQA